MAHPLVAGRQDPRRLRQTEIGLPAKDIGSKFGYHGSSAAAAASARELPDAISENTQGLVGDTASDDPSRSGPEAEAQDAPAKAAGHAWYR
jgi:hypothetical protein